jgi:hypothetical protein
MPYYITSSEYIGPNRPKVDTRITIMTAPGRTNMSNEARLTGWLGTTNDFSCYAHGEFETEEAARAQVSANWPDANELEFADALNSFDDDWVAEFTIEK